MAVPDKFNFTIDWSATPYEIVDSWQPWPLFVNCSTSVAELMAEIKKELRMRFEDTLEYKFENQNVKGWMRYLTEQYRQNATAPVDVSDDCTWTTFFRVKLSVNDGNAQQKSFQLEEGVWQRFPTIRDLIGDPASLTPSQLTLQSDSK